LVTLDPEEVTEKLPHWDRLFARRPYRENPDGGTPGN
jgi:hypothetical protein